MRAFLPCGERGGNRKLAKVSGRTYFEILTFTDNGGPGHEMSPLPFREPNFFQVLRQLLFPSHGRW